MSKGSLQPNQRGRKRSSTPPLSPAVERKIVKTAIAAARAAGRELMKCYGRKIRIREKPGAGLVTDVDLASERAAVQVLRKAFPDFGFLTEESEATEPQGKTPARWIIDPLDGTTNYIHGFPMFCVSIAAEWNRELRVGVIYHPTLDDLYVGVRGKGATLNGKRIRVSRTRRLSDSLLTTGFTYRKDRWLAQEMEAFERLSAIARAMRRPGSAALDFAYIARGVFDGFWERRLSPWDWAAGALIVQEAGGKVTDFKGRKLCLDSKEILASNGTLHHELLKAVNTEYGPV